ncbi:hypothetical protein Tco_1203854 [Tanacetum coccineum]
MKPITTRSGVAYEGPSIPTNPSPKKVVEQETGEITNKEQTNFQGIPAPIPPPLSPFYSRNLMVSTTLAKTTPIYRGDNDEIDVFLAIEVPMYIEGYFDSEGDDIYLESLISDDTTHNFDHEPQQIRNESENESLITFSPKSGPFHHEFTGELITIPPRIDREHEDYINRMSLLCVNSSSRTPENFNIIMESLPTYTTLIEDSDSNREEIDIFSRPNDSIPPGIESEDTIFDPGIST